MTTGPIVDLTQQPVAPGTTPAYEGQLLDQNNNPIPGAALLTFTLTIVDVVTKAVVNGIQDVNILNVGRGTVDALGNVTVILQSGDTLLLVATHAKETRALVLIWTWNGGKGAREVRFLIEALSGT